MPITTEQITVAGQPITISKSDAALSTRLIHDGSKVIGLFESTGITHTKNTLFLGTKAECIAEAQRLGLTGLDDYVAADIAKQMEESYAELKVKGESAFQFAAKLIAQTDGATTVDTLVNDIAADRIEKGVIELKPDSQFADIAVGLGKGEVIKP